MEIKKLLYISDMVLSSFQALKRLLVFQKLGLKEIICLLPEARENQEKDFLDQGITCRVFVERSLSASDVLKRAREEKVSMIAATLRQRKGGVFRQPLTRSLIKSSHLPLIFMPKDVETGEPQDKELFSRVVFATRWSPVAEKPLKFLLNCKGIIGELELITVIDKKLSIRDMIDLKKLLANTRGVFLDEGIDAESHVYAGKPSNEIMLARRDYNVNTIVMGKAQTTGLKKWMTGSCSCEVAERAQVPTMIIP